MYQRDYMLRMIEQITTVIATKILKLKQLHKYDEALAATGELYKRLGLPSRTLLARLTARQIADVLSVGGNIQAGKLMATAELIREEASIAEQMGEAERARADRTKALQLHLLAFEHDPYPLPDEPIDLLAAQAGEELTPADQALLAHYYERTGRLERAVELLITLLETEETPERRQESLRLLARWSGYSDEELAAGGLTRTALAGLLARLQRSVE